MTVKTFAEIQLTPEQHTTAILREAEHIVANAALGAYPRIRTLNDLEHEVARCGTNLSSALRNTETYKVLRILLPRGRG